MAATIIYVFYDSKILKKVIVEMLELGLKASEARASPA